MAAVVRNDAADKESNAELLKLQLSLNRAHKERLLGQIEAWAQAQEHLISQLLPTGDENCVEVRQAVATASTTNEETGSTEMGADGALGAREESIEVEDDAVDPRLDADRAEIESSGINVVEHGREVLARHEEVSSVVKAKVQERRLSRMVSQGMAVQMTSTQQDVASRLLRVCSCILFHRFFEMGMGSIILSHVFFMGWQADYDMTNAVKGVQDDSVAILTIEIIFNTIYTLEMMLKLYVTRRRFIFSEDVNWNVFDSFLVITSWFGIVTRIQGQEAEGDVSQLRVLRLMKMLRVFRVFQLMRALKELRLIIGSMMNSMKTMIWAVMLIGAVCFMFGICFVQASTSFLQNPGNEVFQEQLVKWWGSVGTSMISLFIASMGGADWSDIADTLKPVGMLYFYLFLGYIGFFFTVVTNTLTSLFVESAMAASDKDQAAVVSAELEKKDKYIEKLRDWYEELDQDKDGFISIDEFMLQSSSAEMVEFCLDMDISILEIKHFFVVLSSNGQRKVDLETFIIGCIKLRGTAKSVDLLDLYWEHKETASQLKKLAEMCNQEFVNMRSSLGLQSMPSTPARAIRTDSRHSKDHQTAAAVPAATPTFRKAEASQKSNIASGQLACL